jgi:hypothetical protein
MDELLRDHGHSVIVLLVVVIATVLGAVYKLGWLTPKQGKWDGKTERRECTQHPLMKQKVCSLYEKLEGLDLKVDALSEKLQYILGALENRWGKKP